jgi:hypothetical protein
MYFAIVEWARRCKCRNVVEKLKNYDESSSSVSLVQRSDWNTEKAYMSSLELVPLQSDGVENEGRHLATSQTRLFQYMHYNLKASCGSLESYHLTWVTIGGSGRKQNVVFLWRAFLVPMQSTRPIITLFLFATSFSSLGGIRISPSEAHLNVIGRK